MRSGLLFLDLPSPFLAMRILGLLPYSRVSIEKEERTGIADFGLD